MHFEKCRWYYTLIPCQRLWEHISHYYDLFTKEAFLGRPYYPRARGGCFTRGVYKGKYQIYVKLRFETLDIIFNDLWPQKWIPGQILILLDTHNLSVRQKLSFLDLPKMANGKAKWQIWQCVLWAIFDVQTSYGCLKVSEFDQEFISEVKDH